MEEACVEEVWDAVVPTECVGLRASVQAASLRGASAVGEPGVQVRLKLPRRTGWERLSFWLQDKAREVAVPVSVRVGSTGPAMVEERNSMLGGVEGKAVVRVTVGGAVMTGKLALALPPEKSALFTILSRLDHDPILVGGVMVTGLGIVALAVDRVEVVFWPDAML